MSNLGKTMKSPVSSRDIRFLEKLCYVGKFLCVTPFHDFKKSVICYPTLNKIYSASVMTFWMVSSIHEVYKRYSPSSGYYAMATVALKNLNESFIVLFLLSVTTSCNFLHPSKWVKLVAKFEFIDGQLHRRQDKIEIIQFAAIHLLIIIAGTYVFFVWVTLRRFLWVFEEYSFQELCRYFEVFIKVFMYVITTALRCRYELMNEMLKTSLVSKRVVTKDYTDSVRKFEKLTRVLSEIAAIFNRIYGWPLVFMVSRSTIEFLSILHDVTNVNNPIHARPDLIAVFIVRSVLTLVSTFLIIDSCDLVVEESRRTTSLCWRLQMNRSVDCQERRELRRLVEHVEVNTPEFTAAGLFKIKRGIMFSIMGAAVTYYMVLIQFSRGVIRSIWVNPAH